jgi:hypothetical protein
VEIDMRSRNVVGWFVLSLCVWAVTPQAAEAQTAASPDGEAMAMVLARDAPEMLRETLVEMYETSPTFRRQCRRLAAVGPVPIRLHVDARLPSASARARTSFDSRGGRVVAADVVLPASRDVSELIAHEIEHVLEQLDGIDLGQHTDTAAAWRSSGGAFETARAITIGRRVAKEVRTGTSLVLVRR